MILMRQSNILSRTNPALAVELASEAAELIDGRQVGRLAASVTRQQALAALANHDERAFHRHAADALELGNIDPVPGDRAIYAHAAYIASDIAAGYLRVGRSAEALALLAKHRHSWTSTQHRDHAVAGMRMLHALIAVGEYSIALTEADATRALPGRAVPAGRSRSRPGRHTSARPPTPRSQSGPAAVAGRKNATQESHMGRRSSRISARATRSRPRVWRSCRSVPSNSTAPIYRWPPTPSSPAPSRRQSPTPQCFPTSTDHLQLLSRALRLPRHPQHHPYDPCRSRLRHC